MTTQQEISLYRLLPTSDILCFKVPYFMECCKFQQCVERPLQEEFYQHLDEYRICNKGLEYIFDQAIVVASNQ